MQQAKAPFKWRFLFYREVAAISATYPNLNGTSFPENIDSFPKKTEPGIEDLTKIEQYHAKYAAHDLAGANAILSTYPELKTKVHIAKQHKNLSQIEMQRTTYSIRSQINNLLH